MATAANSYGNSATFIRITPELANLWLAKNTCNRKISKPVVAKYADAMAAGRWEVTGETISISIDGELLNGQHRLQACALSGCSFASWVVFGVPRSAFAWIDTGKTRSGGDVLFISGERHTRALSSALTLLWKYRNGMHEKFSGPTNKDRLELLEANPKVRESVLIGIATKHILMVPVASVVHYEGTLIDSDKTNQFFEGIKTGVGLEDGNAALMLRNAMIRQQGYARNAHAMSARWMMGITVKAFNAFLYSKRMGLLRFTSEEKIPRIGA